MMGIQGCCQANLQHEPYSMVMRQGNRACPVSPIYMRELEEGATQDVSINNQPSQSAISTESTSSSEG